MSNRNKRKKKQREERAFLEVEREREQTLRLRKPTTKQRMLYFFVGLIMNILPTYLFFSIYEMDLIKSLPLFAFVTIICSIILSMGYHNVSFFLKHRLIKKSGVNFQIKRTKKKATGGEREERQKKQLESTITTQAVSLSLLYNSLFYLAIVLIFAFYITWIFQAPTNYILSLAVASSIVTYISSTKIQ
ncbi:translocon-associated protein trap [Anaeramoeba flamelloides]|uniref:Translocon-associated protein subunit gamma n=1 Tax=Anaeramoeba flamelloides TaxID=1746091 RepID=A0AAV7YWC1_9EUKA|nr:translocon-associated protein trap gamma subunit [Anaeramoeba flamelloides]KAJ6238785.1 translocon-associated protein trap [Anaeramoeba flamelloides]